MKDPIVEFSVPVLARLARAVHENGGDGEMFNAVAELMVQAITGSYQLGFCIYHKINESAKLGRELTPEETEAEWKVALHRFSVERKIAERDRTKPTETTGELSDERAREILKKLLDS